MGIGASGITFYDDATSLFFSPHAVNKSNMVSACNRRIRIFGEKKLG
jgi:hypothetical protein